MFRKGLMFVIIGLSLLGLSSSSLGVSGGRNRLAEFKGDVQIKRVKWPYFKKAQPASFLSHQDQIKLAATASAIILCSDTEKRPVKPAKISLVSEVCPSGNATEIRDNLHRRPSRAPVDTIPYLISPRQTFLLNSRPILRWNKVDGATYYQVKVRDVGLTFEWEADTNTTEILYSGEPLKPGIYYNLIVVTDQGNSSQEEQAIDLSFRVLDAQKADLVKAEIKEIKQQQLNPEIEGLAIADLYQNYNLNAEAIALLEGLVQRGSQTVAIYQALGDLYLDIGLSQQGKNTLIKASELAKKQGDLEGEGLAQIGIGVAAYNLGEKEKAIAAFKQAKEHYQVLEDESKVEEIEKRIIDINNPTP